jgi:DNA-binding beta-propeller fold protein YncE
LLALLLSVGAGCDGFRTASPPTAEGVPPVAWPEPPDEPRIELTAAFASASDLGIEQSIFTRLANVITGRNEVRMVRPTGVAASGSRIAVADPGAAAVHVYDRNGRSALTLEGCGEAAFAEPVAVALLGERLYVSDSVAARVDVFDVDGECESSWPLEQGSRPGGLAADAPRSRVYVADVGLHQVLGFDTDGNRQLRFGRRGAGAGEFNYPTWVAVDAAGTLYVTDALNFRVQIFDPQGQPLEQFGRQGDSSGDLAGPKGIGVDRSGHIYLVDALFDAVQMFDREGRYLMVFGGRGREPGSFWLPSGLAVDGDRIYVADAYNQRVQAFRFLGGQR